MQAKDRELAEAQQKLREKVNGVKCVHNMAGDPSDCRRNS